jgi:hypothetical protein
MQQRVVEDGAFERCDELVEMTRADVMGAEQRFQRSAPAVDECGAEVIELIIVDGSLVQGCDDVRQRPVVQSGVQGSKMGSDLIAKRPVSRCNRCGGLRQYIVQKRASISPVSIQGSPTQPRMLRNSLMGHRFDTDLNK